MFFGSDFVTITKSEDYAWAVLKPDVFAAIMDFYSSGEPLFYDAQAAGHAEHMVTEDDDEVGWVLVGGWWVGGWMGGWVALRRRGCMGGLGGWEVWVLAGCRCWLPATLNLLHSAAHAHLCLLACLPCLPARFPTPGCPALQVVAMIKELLETRIRPAVMEDGGDIVFRSFDPDTGVVTLKMMGACR